MDIESLCRLCGQSHLDSLVPIFSFENGRLISDMITLICPISIIVNEPHIPSKICKECLHTIKTAFDLRETSVRIDCKFRNRDELIRSMAIKEENENLIHNEEWPKCEEETTIVFDMNVEREIEKDTLNSENDDGNDYPDFQLPTLIETQEMTKPKRIGNGLIIENGLFKCPECPETFRYESNVGAHYREFHSSTAIPRFKHRLKSTNCEICGLFISQSTNYTRHLNQYHDPSLPYACPLCTYRFSQLTKLKLHGFKFHSKENIKPLDNNKPVNNLVECDLCGKKYGDLKSIKIHMRRTHGVANQSTTKPYPNSPDRIVCPHCDKTATTQSNLYRHISNAHPEKFPHPCSHCPEGFRTQRLLFNHLDRVHNMESSNFAIIENRFPLSNELLICHICSEDCGTKKYTLERHLIDEHENQLENVQQCTTCQKKFVFEDTWKYHQHWHQRKNLEKEYSFFCVQCNKRFATEEKLEKHTMTHAQISLICHICGKSLKSRFSYEFHIKRHADVREYQCPKCPSSYVYIRQLERHMITHAEERKYVCRHPGCTKTFKDSYIYHLHQKRHNGQLQRKYPCAYAGCEKKFYSKYALDRHILTHTLEKPHKCEYCDAAYSQKNELIKHLKIHLGDNVYRCTVDGCSEGFRSHADLRKHFSEQHIKR